MGLKQSIVMKVEFTNKYQAGNHGSTPGKFITRYISRMDAAEPMTSLDLDTNIEPILQFKRRYDVRDGISDKSIIEYANSVDFFNKVRKQESLDGKAFGVNGLSYSNKQTRAVAKQVQGLYDDGHSVSKLVFSFSHDYMTRHKMVDDSYENHGYGSLHGRVDQLRVRQAVSDAMNTLTTEGDYVNPVWIATIHSNTDDLHVHCVLADDVDLDKSNRLVPNQLAKQDYGFVTPTQSKKFRQAMDRKFRELDTMAVFQQEQPSDSLNLDLGGKKIAYSHYRINTTLQKLTASLPKDTNKWDTFAEPELMKRPNEWLHTYITEIMQTYPQRSGWDKLQPVMNQRLQQIPEDNRLAYANYLEDSFYRLSEGHILDDIKDDLDYQPLTEHSMYLTQQAVDTDDPKEMQAAFDLNMQQSSEQASMSLQHLVQYQKRRKDHEKQAKIMNTQLRLFDLDHQKDSDFTDESPIRQWYKVHGAAERQRADKYRYLLKGQDPVEPNLDELNQKYEDLIKDHKRVRALMTVKIPTQDELSDVVADGLNEADDVVGAQKYRDLINNAYNNQPISVEDAKKLDEFGEDKNLMLGTKTYYSQNPQLFREDSFKEASDYAMKLSEYSYECWDSGLIAYDEVEDTYGYMNDLMNGINRAPKKVTNRDTVLSRTYFDTVKGSDLHDVINDFAKDDDRTLSDSTLMVYQKVTNRELNVDILADNYFEKRGQESPIITESLERSTTHKRFSDFVDETGQLPEKSDMQSDEMLPETLAEKRNLAAMSLSDAEFDTNKHLQLMQNVAEEYRLQLMEQIKEYQAQAQQDVPELQPYINESPNTPMLDDSQQENQFD